MASSPDATRSDAGPEPSWDDLRLFLAVVAHGSMNAAARALGQSQPTVARRIRALEDRFGAALFHRGANRLDLTEAGRAVFETAAPMGEAARAVSTLAAAYRPDPHSPVRVTATMSVTMFLSRYAADLARATEPTPIAYLPTRRRLDLAAGEADLALRAKLPADEDLIVRKVGCITHAVYARSPDLATIIVPPEDPDLTLQAALIARFAQGRTVAARIGDTPVRYQAAKSGLGAAVLPCWLGDTDPDLVRVLEPTDDDTDDIFLVLHRRSRSRPPVTRVAAALTDLFKRHERTLKGLG
jgi:DNA-binding transcriptional LysR family regulator